MTGTTHHSPRCPYCLSPVLPAEDSVVCSACGIPHHRECWRANTRCTTYGCTGRAIRIPLEPGAKALPTDIRLELPPVELTREDVAAPGPPPPPRPRIGEVLGYQPVEGLDDETDETPTNWRPIVAVFVGWMVFALGIVAVLMWYLPPAPSTQDVPPPRAPRPAASRDHRPDASSRWVKRSCYVLAAPNEDARAVAHLKIGGMVELLTAEGEWARVRLEDGDTGYLPRDVMSTTRPTARAESRP